MPESYSQAGVENSAEAHYCALIETIPVGIVLLDQGGTIVAANAQACAIWKGPAHAFVGRNLVELTDPSRVLSVNSEWNEFLRTGQREGHNEFYRADGALRCIEYRAVADWMPGRHLVVIRDVTTERAWAHRQIDAERELTNVLDNVPALISRYDRNLRFVYTNRKMLEVAGKQPSEVVGKTHAEVGFAESDCRLWDQYLRDVFRQGRTFAHVTYEPNTAQGARWYESQLVPQFGDDGEVESVLTISRDITDRKNVETQQRETEDRLALLNADLAHQSSVFRLVLDCMADGVALTDSEGNLIFFNPAALRILGTEQFRVSPEKWADHFGMYRRDGQTKMGVDEMPLVRALKGERCDDEEILIRNEQRPSGVWILASARQLLDGQGRSRGAVAVFRDITREKSAQEDLARASRDLQRKAEQLQRSNADLEHFAHVASHDLKEPLRMVTSYTQLLERRYAAVLDRDAREFIGFAVDGARRMSRLLDDLLKYYRAGKQDRPLVDVDCEQLLSNVRENLEPWLRETGARLTHGPLPIVHGDPGQLRQVFHNLIQNAVKYRGEKAPVIHVSAERRDDDWLFAVCDNGVGVEDIAKDRLFAIFQRVHRDDDSGGAGIGLAICRRVITRHGGRIWTEPNPGGGTVFFFTLPV